MHSVQAGGRRGEAASLSSPGEQRKVRRGGLLGLQGKERACVLQAALLGPWRMLVVPHSDSQDCAQGRRAGRVSAGAWACLRAPTRCPPAVWAAGASY